MLRKLVQGRRPVSGLVVSIGVLGRRRQGTQTPGVFRDFVPTLIEDGDFATEIGPDEFLLIFPGARGPAAQRKLNAIAERLWAFQLQSLSHASAMFSWGGIEVSNQSIGDAIASASERMQETQRGRKVLAMKASEAQSLPTAGSAA